ncbi:thioredoxin-like protein [Ceratobasidium sp. AG-I]|nr:thioredoxin-like protein [Ceratobasidium sp. AG-I]
MYSAMIRQPFLRRGVLTSSTGLRQFSSAQAQRRQLRDVTPQVFEEVVIKGGSKPVLVDFYADWCQPCRMLSPILDKYTGDPSNVDGKEVDLVTVDVDAHQELAAKYKVTALPTVVAFKNGKVVDSFIGLLNPAGVKSFIRKL